MKWLDFFDMLYNLLTRKEKDVMRGIRREYEKVAEDLTKQLGVIFSRIEDGKLSYSDIVTARQIARLESRMTAASNRLGKYNRTKIAKLLEESYDLSYGMVSYAIDLATEKTLAGKSPKLPELISLVESTKIEKMRVDAALERSREKNVTAIRQVFAQGLAEGKTFQQIAKKMTRVLDMDYNRAIVITETEVHRIREKASNDKAQNAQRSGIVMSKQWNNVGDERVRHTKRANHVVMQGQKRELNGLFNLGNGVVAPYPGNSQTAFNDIRCRCFASYVVEGIQELDISDSEDRLMQDYEEWRKKR